MSTALIATQHGLIVAQREGSQWTMREHVLRGRHITSVISREGVILAGTTDGVLRSGDRGATWQEASDGLSLRHVRWLAFHPDVSDLEFAGTEPAEIFVSRNGGDSWTSRPEIERLRDQFGWYLPYSPAAGCVRDFTFNGQRVFAAVEVGGVLRSDDNGESWVLAGGSTGVPSLQRVPPLPHVASDVHSVLVHPSSVDLVFAATHDGLYRSEDGGDSWCLLYPDAYCRAMWVNPNDAQHIVLGPASPRGWHGRIQVTHNGGLHWRPALVDWEMPPHTLVERFSQIEDELFAVLSDGQLIATPLAAFSWRRLLPEVPQVTAVTLFPPWINDSGRSTGW